MAAQAAAFIESVYTSERCDNVGRTLQAGCLIMRLERVGIFHLFI